MPIDNPLLISCGIIPLWLWATKLQWPPGFSARVFFCPEMDTHKRKAIALVDGFNLYHAINDEIKRPDLKWLNIVNLLNAFVESGEQLKQVFFYTAYPRWSSEKCERQSKLLDVYKSMGVNIVLGSFKETTSRCKASCGENFVHHSEKETDVNISVTLLRIAHEKLAERVVLLTADSDQVPSIREAIRANPSLRTKVVIPPNRRCDELKQTAHDHATINVAHLERHRLADDFPLRNGTIIKCPGSWRARSG